MLVRTLICFLMVGFAATLCAQEQGLAPGAKVDEFSLSDQHGTSHTLTEILQQGPTAFVFVRSASW